MDLTESWRRVMPASIQARYDFVETRNAAAIMGATNPDEFADLCAVLDGFQLTTADILAAGGNETGIAARLNHGFRSRGWREEQAVTTITNLMRARGPAAGSDLVRAEATSENVGYFIDNVKGRIVLDVEWNAKDGNLDRDLGMYRSLYDVGFIDAAMMITREHTALRDFGRRLRREAGYPDKVVQAWLGTSTTTNTLKLLPRVQSGGAGGCPFLVVAITERTWDETPVPRVLAEPETIPEDDTPAATMLWTGEV